jgi:hypothetical protein
MVTEERTSCCVSHRATAITSESLFLGILKVALPPVGVYWGAADLAPLHAGSSVSEVSSQRRVSEALPYCWNPGGKVGFR